jgi:hypothetical protein
VAQVEEEPLSGDGSVLAGFGIGCLTQVVLGALSFYAALVSACSSPIGKWVVLIGASWGLTQWVVIVPFILRQRAKGHRKTVQGLLIAGGVGVLLSSACAASLFR